MHIFLDFDGVLHPKGAGQTHFTRLPLFEALMAEPCMATATIVISSTWRQAYTLEKLRQFFHPTIAPRIIGTTPTLREYHSEFERGEEIETYISKSSTRRWIAIDDDEEAFAPRLRTRLILCDGTKGLSTEDIAKVRLLASSS